MGTTVDIWFPLRRYHATPWDSAPNTGAVEWPPSPWRILRALLAVAHSKTDGSEEAAPVLERLGNPVAFLTRAGSMGSTRHYMPGVKHRSDERKDTALVLDSFLALPPHSEVPDLRVHWETDLGDDDRKVLDRLLDNLSYLGRSESICDARVSAEAATPDGSWWRVGEAGPGVESVTLLSADGRVTVKNLEADPTSVRSKGRAVYPPGTRMLSFGRHADDSSRTDLRQRSGIRSGADTRLALRLQLQSPVPIRMRRFLLATDRFHAAIRRAMDGAVDPEMVSALIGKEDDGPRRNGHDHIHVIPLPDSAEAPFSGGKAIGSLVVWSPDGIPEPAVDAICQISRLWAPKTVSESAFETQRVLVSGVADVTRIAKEIVTSGSSAVRWRSATPYFPVRHRKRESVAEWLAADLNKELGYRSATADIVANDIAVESGHEAAAEIVQFRRRRFHETRQRNRQGFYVTMTLSGGFSGPLLLGQLSHFGAGLFLPEVSD